MAPLAMVGLAGGVACDARPGEPEGPRPGSTELRAAPGGRRRVHLEGLDGRVVAVLHAPERIADARGLLALHSNAIERAPLPPDWVETGLGGFRFDGTTPDELDAYAPHAADRPLYEKARIDESPLGVHVRLENGPEGIEIFFGLENLGDRTLEDVESSFCLRFVDPELRDTSGARTRLETERGAIPATDPGGGGEIPRRRWTHGDGFPPAGESFWGATIPLEGPARAIVRRSTAGGGVSLSFPEPCAWQTNLSADVNCIHGNPLIRRLAPGATVEVRGAIRRDG
jgi:hypothetical protein